MSGDPVVRDVVLVGAGHAHVEVLRDFGLAPVAGVRLTLVTREVHSPYSGMLPGLVAGLYGFDDAHIDTAPLARFAGAQVVHAEAIGLDLEARRLICRDRPPVPYDILSLDIGARPNTREVPGAAEHAIPVKPIDGFLPRFEALMARTLARAAPTHIAVVGGGAGGTELLLSVERRLRQAFAAAGRDSAELAFTLIAATPEILPTFPTAFRRRLRAILAARGIAVLTGARVERVEPGALAIEGRADLAVDEILWTTEAGAAEWLGSTGLLLDERGFIQVDAHLRALGRPKVFAAGDTIAFALRELPKSGVYAVRAGPVLAANIRASLAGAAPTPFTPQREALYILSTGERYAVATRNGITLGGNLVWRFKDWLDRRFMARFKGLPLGGRAET